MTFRHGDKVTWMGMAKDDSAELISVYFSGGVEYWWCAHDGYPVTQRSEYLRPWAEHEEEEDFDDRSFRELQELAYEDERTDLPEVRGPDCVGVPPGGEPGGVRELLRPVPVRDRPEERVPGAASRRPGPF